MSPCVLILEFLPITFLQSSYWAFVIICHIMASSGKPSGPGHLANDPYLCDICGRGFPTKEV
jgi:hypothetical protein